MNMILKILRERLTLGFVGIVFMVFGVLAAKPFFLSFPILLDTTLLGIDTTGSLSMIDGVVQGFDIFYDLITGALISTYTPLAWVVTVAGILAIQIGLIFVIKSTTELEIKNEH